jgi:hypothetical protein
MFLSHRAVALPEASAFLATHAVVCSGYRVHAVFRENVVAEDALMVRAFDRRGAVGRPVATVLVEGEARMRVPGHDQALRAGDLCMVASKSDVVMRQDGPRYLAVMIEWAEGTWGERPTEGISVRTASGEALSAARAFASRIAAAEDDTDGVAEALAPVWEAFRAHGIPLIEAGEDRLKEPVDPAVLRLSRALDAMQSNLSGAPMMVDLEAALTLSSRQINRLVQEFNERYGFNASGWRDTRNRWRLMIGATLMTAPGATAEGVARAMGFASAATFSRALANAGFPPPGEIAATVARLAEPGSAR